MNKKKTTKKEKQPKQQTNREPLDQFIQSVIYKEITNNIDWITEICRQYEGLNEISKDVWNKLNNLIITISKQAEEQNYNSFYVSTMPRKMDSYSVAHNIREQQRKNIILKWAEQLTKDDVNRNVYICYIIYLNIFIWLSENSKIEKSPESKKKETGDKK